MTTIIIILSLAAIAAAGKILPSILFTPVTSIIHFFGSLLEDGRERLKNYIVNPEPPGLIRYSMSILFTVGSIAYSLLDAIMAEISLKMFLSEKGMKLFSSGISWLDYFMSHYLYSCLSVALILLLTVLIHYAFSYISNKHPQAIEGTAFIAVIVAVIGMITILALMRFYSAQLLLEMNRAITNHNYDLSANLTNKVGWVSMLLFVWGILCAGFCAHLGVNQFITQTAQICAGVVFVSTTILYYAFIIISKIIDSIKAIIEIPVNAVANIMQYTKEMFGKKSLDYRVAGVIIILILSFFLTGCKMPEQHSRLLVVSVDLSNSFHHEHDNSIGKINEVIDCMEEKDAFYCLFINDASYSNKQIIYLLPETEGTDINNKMDYYRTRDSVKQAIADIINTTQANKTDIVGALQRARAIFEGKGKGCDKYLLMFSDISDNVNKDIQMPQLDSINVLILFANADKQQYTEANRQKDNWQNLLENSNVKSLTILEHDLSQSLDVRQYLEGGN